MTKTSTTPPYEFENKPTADKGILRQDLQAVLGQLFELHVQGIEAHAHFRGTRFTGIQRQLAATVQVAREASNAVADELRAWDRSDIRGLIIMEVPPSIPGLRPGERCTTAAVNMITHRISLVISAIRCVRSDSTEVGASATALLGAIADAVDEQAPRLSSESQKIAVRFSADLRRAR
jgi:starvation-inducible DNA-binding protein